MTITTSEASLSILIADWQDALWKELTTAHERGHMDASHDVGADYRSRVRGGPVAYMDDLYELESRKAWGDPVVDKLSQATEACAVAALARMAGAA